VLIRVLGRRLMAGGNSNGGRRIRGKFSRPHEGLASLIEGQVFRRTNGLARAAGSSLGNVVADQGGLGTEAKGLWTRWSFEGTFSPTDDGQFFFEERSSRPIGIRGPDVRTWIRRQTPFDGKVFLILGRFGRSTSGVFFGGVHGCFRSLVVVGAGGSAIASFPEFGRGRGLGG